MNKSFSFLAQKKWNYILILLGSFFLFPFFEQVNAQFNPPPLNPELPPWLQPSSSNELHTSKSWDDYDYSTRVGSEITYYWLYNFDGESTNMELTLDFTRGWQYMQDIYKTKNHQHGNYYKQFVRNDPFKIDGKVLANSLKEIASFYKYDKAKVALSFVQSLPHDPDIGSYQRYAIECLIDAEGDCSDKSVLLMSILANMGYETVELSFPNHLAVGIMEHGKSIFHGTYYIYKGFRFYFAETNGRGYNIGDPGWQKNSSAEISDGFIRAGSIGGTHYNRKCEYCRGTGWRHGGEVPCIYCSGRGHY